MPIHIVQVHRVSVMGLFVSLSHGHARLLGRGVGGQSLHRRARYRSPAKEDSAMKPEATLTDRILKAVSGAPGCRIEEVICQFPDLTWNQASSLV
jgi:hypothetical protein